MKVWTVSVDSTGYSADWNDLLIVVAKNPRAAVARAEDYVLGERPDVEIVHSEAYPLGNPDAVVLGKPA